MKLTEYAEITAYIIGLKRNLHWIKGAIKFVEGELETLQKSIDKTRGGRVESSTKGDKK